VALAKLKIFLLGGFRAEAESRPRITVARKKGQALLALLALRPGSGYPREALTALLWPESSDEEARHSLRQELHELRRALAATKTRALIVEGERVALDPDAVEVDVVKFERLAADASPEALKRAAALYDGDLLVGVGVRESAFEDHLRAERERLRARATGVFTRLLEYQTQRKLVEPAIETALRLLAMDATQEAVHRSVMKLYASTGRRAAALRQYQECVAVLQRELDVEPEPATRQLYRDILASGAAGARDIAEPQKRSSPQASQHAPRGPRGAAATTERAAGDPPLAGRKAELAALGEVLDQVCGRLGHVVSIVGEAGVGKTRLVSELAALAAERDGRTIVGRAYETAQVLALGPWADALRAGLAAEPGALSGLEATWRAELARVLPEADGRTARRSGPADASRIFEAVDRLVARLAARQPLIIVLEDVHWADEFTVRLAAYLSRRIATRPVLLVLTAREEHLADAPLLDVALKELREHPRFVRLSLAALSRDETAALTRSLARAERDQGTLARLDDDVWRISAGNPLLVVETVRAVRDAPAGRHAGASTLPTRVREIVAARLERLSEPARRVVSIASLVGRECDFRLLQHCAGLPDRAAAEVVEELVRRRVFHGVDEGLDFTHDRIREVASHALVPVQRRAIHRLIATSMEDVYVADLERHCAELAAHCREGELWEKALTYLAEAGARATERSAHREAAAFFEQALAALEHLPESQRTLEQAVDIRLALHTSYYAVAELRCGHQALCDAEAPARKLGDARRSALLASQTGQSLWVTGRSREALPLFEHAAAAVRSTSSVPSSTNPPAPTLPRRWVHDPIKVFGKTLDDFALLTSTTLYIGAARFALGDLDVAEESFRHVIEAVGEAAAGEKLGLHGLPLVFAESALTALLAEQGRFDEARAHGTTSVRIAEALNHSYTLVFALRLVGHAYTVEGRLPEAIALLERGRAICDEGGLLALEPNIISSLGYAYSVAGRPDDGVPLIQRALAVLEDYGQRVWYVVMLTQLAESWMLAGDVDRAAESAQRALLVARERGERGFEAGASRVLGAVALRGASPDPAAAREHYAAALELADKRAMQPLIANCHAGLGLVATRLGDLDAARTHLAKARDIRRTIGIETPSALEPDDASSARSQ
jgi:DNA-binding SARP family transcriptional activator